MLVKPKEVWEKVSLWRLGAGAGLLCLALIIIFTCPKVGNFFDLKIALFVGGFPFFMLLGTYKMDFLRFIPDALLALGSESEEKDALYADICTSGIRNTVGAGIVATVVMIMWVFLSGTEPSAMGKAMARGVLAILYAFLAAGVFSYLYDVYTHESPCGGDEEGDGGEAVGEDGDESNTTKNVALGAGMLALIFASLFSYMLGIRARTTADAADDLDIEGELELLEE